MLFGRNLLLRFLAVGLLNTLFGYGVYAFLLFLGANYAWALFFSTVLGVLFNFKSTGFLVFGSVDNRLIFRFILVYLVLYILNAILIKSLHVAGIDFYLSGALLILPMAILAFFMNKCFVFKCVAKNTTAFQSGAKL